MPHLQYLDCRQIGLKLRLPVESWVRAQKQFSLASPLVNPPLSRQSLNVGVLDSLNLVKAVSNVLACH